MQKWTRIAGNSFGEDIKTHKIRSRAGLNLRKPGRIKEIQRKRSKWRCVIKTLARAFCDLGVKGLE